MKIFLTGSTGYVGTKFVDMYGKDFEIFGVARSDENHPINLEDTDNLKRAFNDFQPDVVLHTAAHPSRDTNARKDLVDVTVTIMQNLLDLAMPAKIPFIFTSTEALYGGKEDVGEYQETDTPMPRNRHGESRAACEKLLIASGLPYLITRGHRHVGFSPRFHKQKYFPDTINQLVAGQEVHLDSRKLFKPVLINHVCDIFAYHINNNLDKQIILNTGVDKKTTYYDFITDVAMRLQLDASLIHDDGNEIYWPADSSISVEKLKTLGYPTVTYEEMLETIASDYAAL